MEAACLSAPASPGRPAERKLCVTLFASRREPRRADRPSDAAVRAISFASAARGATVATINRPRRRRRRASVTQLERLARRPSRIQSSHRLSSCLAARDLSAARELGLAANHWRSTSSRRSSGRPLAREAAAAAAAASLVVLSRNALLFAEAQERRR